MKYSDKHGWVIDELVKLGEYRLASLAVDIELAEGKCYKVKDNAKWFIGRKYVIAGYDELERLDDKVAYIMYIEEDSTYIVGCKVGCKRKKALYWECGGRGCKFAEKYGVCNRGEKNPRYIFSKAMMACIEAFWNGFGSQKSVAEGGVQ